MTEYSTETDFKPGALRDQFRFPVGPGGEDCLYLCGNSLGLQPVNTADAVTAELERWARLAVAGHFDSPLGWMDMHKPIAESLAPIVGGDPVEIVVMNALTVNLHLMMASFYRPQAERRRILIERGAFPSDRHAVVSQLELHGFDSNADLVELAPRRDGLLHEEDLEDYLERYGDQTALVLWPGVQYATGQVFDMERVSRACQRAGVTLGLDLAHAVGNVPLALNAWGADFAVWCSYKYLNGGPGSVAGCFIHKRHLDKDLPRLAGWWGHEQSSRMKMAPEFTPARGAEGWQISNLPILTLATLQPSLALFDKVGMDNLRSASLEMTGHLATKINDELGDRLEIITPLEPHRRGCQLSIRVRDGQGNNKGRLLFERLEAHGIIGDWREPDIIRVAPAPLYNSIEDCDRLVADISRLFPNDD